MSLQYRILPRTLRFKTPAGTSRGVYLTRDVWYIVLRKGDKFGLGECAPLPDLSEDALPRKVYAERLESFLKAWATSETFDFAALQNYPSMLFGIETALRTLDHGLLSPFPDTPFARAESAVPVNGLVWMGTHEEMAARMEEKLRQGFRCIKIKIGAIDFNQEYALIRSLRERFPASQIEIRVDANGAFAPEEAPGRLAQLAKLDLHSIEQPIRAGQWEAMADICRHSPIPVALDEELIGIHGAERGALLDRIRPQYVVLKPSLHGGISGTEEWISEARRRGIGYWLTSALESNVGLNAVAGLAGAHPEIVMHQGLGTGSLFVENFSHTTLRLEGEKMWARDAKQREYEDKLHRLRSAWESSAPTMRLHTSGSTGTPRPVEADKAKMRGSAHRTCAHFGLGRGDTALLCLPLEYVGGMMQAVRAFEAGMRIIAVAPCARPLQGLRVSPRFAAMTPHQVFETLQHSRERRLFSGIGDVIVGGGAISPELARMLKTLPCRVWSTYGMTETLSHIALRRASGAEAEQAYRPLRGVTVRIDADGCLCITDPTTADGEIATNDLAALHADGFCITGRRDNVVCSGGLKLQIEALEERLGPIGAPYALTGVPDARFGEALALVYAGSPKQTEAIAAQVGARLHGAERPKHICCTESPLPQTATGKPARKALRELAEKLLSDNGLGKAKT